MDEFRFDAEGLGRVRFVVSPLWETLLALRILIDPRPRAYHLPWLESVRPALDDLDLVPLLAVTPLRGYTPDFLAPPPIEGGVTIDAQLDAVRRTSLSQVRAELQRTIADRGGAGADPELRRLANRPRVARERYADALAECWHRLVEPYWRRLSDLLAADIAHHSRILATGGLQAVLPELSPQVRWTGRSVQVRHHHERWRRRADRIVVIGERGLVLQPSAFAWPLVQVITDEPWQPAIVYPARGIAELWQPVVTTASDALGRLVGRTRALLLTSLREPTSTTTLARRHELSPGTVSVHLSVLSDAGLVTSARQGRTVVYSLTGLGIDLLGPGA